MERLALWEQVESKAAFWGGAVLRATLWASMVWMAEMKRQLELQSLCDDCLGLVADADRRVRRAQAYGTGH